MRRLLPLLFLLALTGCSASTQLTVHANNDGSGHIAVRETLDAEASKAAGDLKQKLAATDLTSRGWKVGDTNNVDGGGQSIEISHSFTSINEANALMNELTGSTGAFKAFVLMQTRSGLKINSSFSGTADLSQGIASFGDQTLVARTGSALGFDQNEFFSEYKINDTAFPVTVKVELPGETKTVTPALVDGTWKLPYAQVTALNATSSGLAWRPIILFGIGIGLLVAAVVVLIIWTVETYRPRHVK